MKVERIHSRSGRLDPADQMEICSFHSLFDMGLPLIRSLAGKEEGAQIDASSKNRYARPGFNNLIYSLRSHSCAVDVQL